MLHSSASATLEHVELAIELGLNVEKTTMLPKLRGGELRKLLRKESEEPAFSYRDVAIFFAEMTRNRDIFIDRELPTVTHVVEKKQLPDFNDVLIATIDGTVACNRFVLAVFSPYFKTLFFSEFEDKSKEEIQMDVDSSTLTLLIQILIDRSKSVFNNWKQCAELFKAADQYDFPCIRDLCCQYFLKYDLSTSLNIALFLNLKEEKALLIAKMTFSDFKQWEEKAPKDDEIPLLSHKDLDAIMRRCYETEAMYRCSCGPRRSYVNASWHLQDDEESARKCPECGLDLLSKRLREED